jgi:glycine/D-amino acid oxidase-like deaminating enzyme
VSDGAIGAYEPDGAGVDPVRTVETFAALAREAGAVTRIGVRVTDLRVENGRVTGVETNEGLIEAESVIVATGPWSQPLLARAGIELPLRVVRPEQHFLALPRIGASASEDARERLEDIALERFGLGRSALLPAAHPVILDLERNFYTRCEGHAARTRVGRMDYVLDEEVKDPDALDEQVTEEYKRWARREIERRIPRYRDQPDVGSQAGMYTLTPDAQALIGQTNSPKGLILVTGFSGHGFKLAPSVGEGVAQMLRGEKVTAFDARFFAPDRFTGKPEGRWGGAFGL